jgi:hypothetical protein
VVVFVGAVFLVQGIDDQSYETKAQGEYESGKHGVPPLDCVLIEKYRRKSS